MDLYNKLQELYQQREKLDLKIDLLREMLGEPQENDSMVSETRPYIPDVPKVERKQAKELDDLTTAKKEYVEVKNGKEIHVTEEWIGPPGNF